jgi:hypothetical protein
MNNAPRKCARCCGLRWKGSKLKSRASIGFAAVLRAESKASSGFLGECRAPLLQLEHLLDERVFSCDSFHWPQSKFFKADPCRSQIAPNSVDRPWQKAAMRPELANAAAS